MKTCNNKGDCEYKALGESKCTYEGYCDYQAPKDSRFISLHPPINEEEE